MAEYYKINISNRCFCSVARPRYVVMALSKELTTQSLSEVGHTID